MNYFAIIVFFYTFAFMNEEHKNYTMKDIAVALGVSVATVSRALNDSPAISADRRKQIREFAEAHDFHPNAIAENLRNSRIKPQKLIGVIVPELVHYFFSTVLSGIEEEAARRGYHIMVAQSLEDYEREVRICESFRKNKVCGIIISQAKSTLQYDHLRQIVNESLPLVFFDRICTGIDASRVVVDDYHGAFQAVSYLIETGCRRIAFCGKPLHLEIVKNRLNGYKDALATHGLTVDESLILECDNRKVAESVIPAVIAHENRPDAFFAVNDDTAVGILHVVKSAGLRVPEDVSICGFTNGVRALVCDPMLTTVDQRGQELGRQAADILISQVEGELPTDKVQKRVVRTTLIKRGTTKNI